MIGLQLYTVRKECAQDFAGTLRAVAELGYEGVELTGLYGYDAALVRSWIDDVGLRVCARHASLHELQHRLPELAEELAVLGTQRLVLALIEPPTTAERAEESMQSVASIAARAAELGLDFGFHNHDGELRPIGGRTFLQRLLDETEIFLELDLGWAWWAGADPVDLLRTAKHRAPLLHIKDFRVRGELSFCPVGDGSVGYDLVAPAAAAAGAEWLLVEQDETEGPALAAARRSLESLRSLL